jgi:xanthine dehydrogenase small subunit
MARAYLHLSINGRRHRVTGDDALLSLSDFLRHRLGLVGTKIVCSEGDCGACSVIIARSGEAAGRYVPVDACITWMFQLDRASIITIEGLRRGDELHAMQRAMIEGHGSQCGFCTPGFVMAMAALAADAAAAGREAMSDGELRRGLTGNLCRCTGYSQIIEAGRSVDLSGIEPLMRRNPPAELGALDEHASAGVRIIGDGGREVCVPASLHEAVEYLAASPEAKIVCGATDVGVQINKGAITPGKVLYIGGLAELKRVVSAQGRLTIGAAATWYDVAAAVKDLLPPLAQIIERFGAPQVRHAATIGGNIINASPIADSLPLLYVTDARLRLVNAGGQRWVRMADFVCGYRKLDLRAGELLADVELTLPANGQVLRLYKVSKRRDLDISTFTAAMLFTLAGDRVEEARIAYGGVGPVVLRLPRAEAHLRGKVLTEALMTEAGAIARGEVAPITDVRASSDYRSELANTILLKAYHDITHDEAVSR